MTESPALTAEVGETTPEPTAPSEKTRWAAFWVILVAIVLLVVTPIVTGILAQSKPENVVGVYERAMLQVEDDGRSVHGAFIAPQGWERDPADGALDAEAAKRTFTTQDGGVSVIASMHTGVESAALLRDAAPVGAALIPVRTLDSAPLLTVKLLEYDLAAGAGSTQLIAVCEALRDASCVLFEVSIAATHVNTDGGQLLPDIAAIVESAEVQP
jgi:hypothetical protein